MPSEKDEAQQELVPATPITDVTKAAARVAGEEQAQAEIAEVEARIEHETALAEDPEAKQPKPRTFPEDHTHYVITLWKGIPNFSCKDCGYAKVSRDEQAGVRAVMSHWVENHSEDAGVEMVPTGITDTRGNPIMRRQQRRRG